MTLVDGPQPGAYAVSVWSLEQLDACRIEPGRTPEALPRMVRVVDEKAGLSRECYRRVGADWHWVDRADWELERWAQWTDRPEHHLAIAYDDDRIVGYYELEQQLDGVVEIAYFGVTPDAMGRGIGGWLLTEALTHAWQLPGTRRVWVHTCSLDAPAALRNYEARGMTRFAEHIEWRLVTPRLRP